MFPYVVPSVDPSGYHRYVTSDVTSVNIYRAPSEQQVGGYTRRKAATLEQFKSLEHIIA